MNRSPMMLIPPKPPTSTRATPHELRLALAMRGGVSLAVWIGGACREIDALRLSVSGQAIPHTTSKMYEWLLNANGYGKVTIDVISGASAGGLNGALLSSTLMYGVDFSKMKRVWLTLADIEPLMRSTKISKPESVLMGDDYFLPRVRETLQRLIEESNGNSTRHTKGPSLDLWLATTLVAPKEILIYDDWTDRYIEKTQAATFHFRSSPNGSDFDIDGSPESVGTIAHRLALAGRASSSFPGAFEPATIKVNRPESLGDRPGLADQENMFGLFSDSSRRSQFVMDGGVLDNIPVARAIKSIAAAGADGPTERWLLFLHPSPEMATESFVPQSNQRPDALKTVLESLKAGLGRESLYDDIAVLREHNEAALRHGDLRAAMLHEIMEKSTGEGLESLIKEAGDRYNEYVRLRADMAAARIRYLLEDPTSVLGEDPFTDDKFRTPLGQLQDSDWSQQKRFTLQQKLAAALSDPPPWPGREPTDDISLVHKLGAPPLRRAIDTLLELVRSLERSDHADKFSPELASAKADLYGLRTTAELLVHIGDLFWPVYGALLRVQATKDWAEASLKAREELLRFYIRGTAGTPRDLPESVRHEFEYLRKEFMRVSRAYMQRDPDIIHILWNRLAGSVRELARLCKDLASDLDGFHEVLLVARALAAVHGGDEAGNIRRSIKFLATLEILSFPLDVTAPTGNQYIHFMRISGASPTPLEPLFPGHTLSVKDKLAGNELNNFAAFYKASWRANDWMWGRLDAATGLINLVLRSESLHKHFMTNGEPDRAVDFLKQVEDMVTAPVAGPLTITEDQQQEWKSFFENLWTSYSQDVKQEIEAVAGGDVANPLKKTKDALIARRHWELLIWELKDVAEMAFAEELSEGSAPETSYLDRMRGRWTTRARARLKNESLMQAVLTVEGRHMDPFRSPRGMKELLGKYSVGKETIAGEAGTDRFTRVAANLSVVAWNAVPGTLDIPALKPISGALTLMRSLALAITRSPKWALALLLTVLAVGVYSALEDKSWLGGRFGGTLVAVGAFALLIYGAARLGRLLTVGALIAVAALGARQVSGTITVEIGGKAIDIQVTKWQSMILLVTLAFIAWAGAQLRRAWRQLRR